MATKNGLSRVTIDMPATMHKRLKAQAAIRGKSMRQIILNALEATEECRLSGHIPNKTTQRVIKDAQQGKNLVEAKNINDLFKKLGL